KVCPHCTDCKILRKSIHNEYKLVKVIIMDKSKQVQKKGNLTAFIIGMILILILIIIMMYM
ncbi:MAG TPA: hypothetical protein DCY35_02190, partial [Prolixibacteraceae bacterium]|nr:hypothetical protein [Prolixibacteraceae bacterium]